MQRIDPAHVWSSPYNCKACIHNLDHLLSLIWTAFISTTYNWKKSNSLSFLSLKPKPQFVPVHGLTACFLWPIPCLLLHKTVEYNIVPTSHRTMTAWSRKQPWSSSVCFCLFAFHCGNLSRGLTVKFSHWRFFRPWKPEISCLQDSSACSFIILGRDSPVSYLVCFPKNTLSVFNSLVFGRYPVKMKYNICSWRKEVT